MGQPSLRGSVWKGPCGGGGGGGGEEGGSCTGVWSTVVLEREGLQLYTNRPQSITGWGGNLIIAGVQL